MHILRKLLYGLAIVVVALAVIAFFVPRHVRVERALTMRAPPTAVFELVNGFKRFNEFSPWFEHDPRAKYTYTGPESGVGARMEWTSDSVGSGSQEIVKSESPTAVHTKLDFGAQGTAMAVWTIEPTDDGSRVTWAFETDLGMNPIARYMGLTFEHFIGPDYEKGLANLKKLAEAQTTQTAQTAETS
ncbi:MAG: SRPBCC family protein [Gammaproteobacteria bacterium]